MDDRTGDELMRRSVLGGSAIGVLLSLHSGVMDRRLAQAMPFGGLQDAFDLVLDKAEQRGGGSTAGLQVKMSAGKSAEALPYGSASARCHMAAPPRFFRSVGHKTALWI